MKFKEGFELRDICGESALIPTGIENINFSNLISLSESAALVYQHMQGREFTADEAAELLCKEYEVDKATAKADIEALHKRLVELGVAE